MTRLFAVLGSLAVGVVLWRLARADVRRAFAAAHLPIHRTYEPSRN